MGKKPVQAQFRPGKRMHADIVRQYRLKSGVCRWCRCTEDDACPVPGSCAWADPEQTICTACTPVEIAWNRLELSKKPNMHRAFFRGFMAGCDDERATERDNPNRRGGETARYWDLGYKASGAA